MHHISNSAIDRTVAEHAPYTSVHLGEQLGVSEATIRNRWFPWIAKVAPEPLLKDGKGYTELARSLFTELAQVPSKKAERERWVNEAKSRYAQEWASVGVIEGELMPDAVGGALALLEANNTDMNALLQAEMGNLEAFLYQVGAAEEDFSEAELRSFQLSGARRGLKRFQIETQAELDTVNALRQQRLGPPPQ